jgi:hypothetical protein
MPLSPPSIFPGHGLLGADHPHIGAKYSLAFIPGKLTNPPLGLPQTKWVSFLIPQAVWSRYLCFSSSMGIFPFKSEQRLANQGQAEAEESIL